MGKLIYATNTSLDGFTEDATGSFDWSEPDEDVHEFYNDMMRGIGTQLLGRRMYETMAVWETEPAFFEESAMLAGFAAAWQDSDKLVYSTTLADPVTTRTRIVRAFEADEVRALKEASSAELLVSGPALAAHALRAGVGGSRQAGLADRSAPGSRAHRRAPLRQRRGARGVSRAVLITACRGRHPGDSKPSWAPVHEWRVFR